MVIFALALVRFLLRLGYLLKFRYKTGLDRPPKYPEAKRILTAASFLSVATGALVLSVMGDWALAVVLVVCCLLANYAANFYAYQRAVNETALWLTSVPVEARHKIAAIQVDLAIKDGTRI